MAEAAIFSIVKYGLDAYNYFQACRDKTCYMKVKVESGNKLVFSAYDHRSFLVKLLNHKPWHMNFLEHYAFKKERLREKLKEKVYVSITVVCQDKDEFRRLLDKFHVNERIKQSDLIDYLKEITRHGYVHLKLIEEITPCSRIISGEVPCIVFWDEYTAVYEIDAS